MSLRSALATPDGKRRYVRTLFATIADRYDLITRLLSVGRDRGWKLRLAEMARVRLGERAVDLACGTGDIAFEIARRGARVVGLDLTRQMIALARAKRRSERPAVRSGDVGGGATPAFVVGDMMALPFPDESFDLVTVGYGIRNVPIAEVALGEIYRVLRPDGRVLSLDFDRPPNGLVRRAYFAYLTVVGSAVGLALHRDPDTYRYIPESLREYPGAAGIAERMRGIGFAEAGYVPLLGGLMAINHATKGPGAASRRGGASS